MGAAAPAALQPPDVAVLAGTTSRSLKDFGACFSALQEKQARRFWFVPNDLGGRFSNDGPGISNPYQIRFIESDRQNRVEVSVGQLGGANEKSLIDDIKSCW